MSDGFSLGGLNQNKRIVQQQQPNLTTLASKFVDDNHSEENGSASGAIHSVCNLTKNRISSDEKKEKKSQ
jgi:hypothetical protein